MTPLGRRKEGENAMQLFRWSGLVLVAALLASCGGEHKFRIGVAGPLTGKDAVFGAQLKYGA